MRKAALHNLGCKVNAYETEAMGQLLSEAGYELVPFREKADVYIINTCSVTNIADRKSRQMIHRARKQNPEAVVVAAGCYVQAAAEELKKDLSADILIGNNKKKDLVPILERYFAGREERAFLLDIGAAKEYESLSLSSVSGHTRAFLKVQDGCNQFCSYCVIPYTRGRVRSRDAEDAEREARRLAVQGYQELVLTGIHLSSYGTDLAPEKTGTSFSEAGPGQPLLALIRRLHEIDGIRRIRLGSLEPRIITEDFAAALAGMEKICPHFHLSLQSGCDETLKRMNRHYTAAEYEERCRILRRYFDRPAITTDVIVGFPGETEEEFARSREFLRRIRFYEMHVFKYSMRDGTRAAQMPEQVPEPVKTARSEELLALEREMSLAYRRSFLGKTCQVLLEEPAEIAGGSWLVGHTREYVKVAVPREGYAVNTLAEFVPERLLTEEILLAGQVRKGQEGEGFP